MWFNKQHVTISSMLKWLHVWPKEVSSCLFLCILVSSISLWGISLKQDILISYLDMSCFALPVLVFRWEIAVKITVWVSCRPIYVPELDQDFQGDRQISGYQWLYKALLYIKQKKIYPSFNLLQYTLAIDCRTPAIFEIS